MVRNIYESSNEDDNNENDPEYLPPPHYVAKANVKDEPKTEVDSLNGNGRIKFYSLINCNDVIYICYGNINRLSGPFLQETKKKSSNPQISRKEVK